ncbi:MAG TPA: hypothetical protein VM661_18010 [Candidatus Sulfotelmatobacter sp.]|jgi:hypothetical protein|nr:hypothetical protein [Candidatus Sulfotelmatobacter sp.]
MAGKFYSSTPAMAGDGDIIAGLIGAVFDLFDLIFRLFKPRRKPAPQ